MAGFVLVSEPRFLIHPGYPKAGSTSLQANVFAHHPDVRYLSNHSAPGDPFRDFGQTIEFHALLRDMKLDSLPRIGELWREHMYPAADTKRLNIISDETFLTNEGPHNEIASSLRDLVCEAKVLIVVRPQEDILRSVYDMYPWLSGDSARRFLPFQKWLDQTLAHAESNVAGALTYCDVVARYRDLFGGEKVTVISFERLFNDPHAQTELCARLGINGAEFSRLIAETPSNTAHDHSSKKLVRRVLGPVRGSSFLTPGQIRAIRGMLTRVLPHRKTEVGPAEQAKIEAFYAGQRITDLGRRWADGLIL